MHWLNEGDLNTELFHMSTTTRRKFKKIKKPMNDNQVAGLCEIEKSYLSHLFKAKEGNHEPVLSFIQPRVSNDDNEIVVVHISKDELHVALLQMHLEKLSGLNGFNMTFYQNF
jgi:hypothetical protein